MRCLPARGFRTPRRERGRAYVALFPSFGAFLLWNLALKSTTSAAAGNYLNLMVVFTAVITLLLGMPVTTPQILGGLLVISGVLLTGMKRRTRQPVMA